jgi:AraC-like DNA-binding protein
LIHIAGYNFKQFQTKSNHFEPLLTVALLASITISQQAFAKIYPFTLSLAQAQTGQPAFSLPRLARTWNATLKQGTMHTRPTLPDASTVVSTPFLQNGGGETHHPISFTGKIAVSLQHRWRYWQVVNHNDRRANLHTRRFLELVDTEYKGEHRPIAYARWLHLSDIQLRKCCQACLAASPGECIGIRIGMEAVALLTDPLLSIKEIALELGFKDANYFTRFFRKNFLLTPTAFREGLLVR